MTRVFLVLFFVLTGCTTLGDARLAKGTGVSRSYEFSFDKTWEAVKCSLNGRGIAIAGENKQEGYIIAQRAMNLYSFGENIAVFVSKREDNKTDVEVVSKRALKTNIVAPDWGQSVLEGVEGCLG